MKALTLTQPWATLVAIGSKHYETRSWQTKYRGPLAIHAAKGFPGHAREECYEARTRRALLAAGFTGDDKLPLGAVIATAVLSDIFPTTQIVSTLSNDEVWFGNYGPGRFAWHLTEVRMLAAPVPAKGALSLWEWDGGPLPLDSVSDASQAQHDGVGGNGR